MHFGGAVVEAGPLISAEVAQAIMNLVNVCLPFQEYEAVWNEAGLLEHQTLV